MLFEVFVIFIYYQRQYGSGILSFIFTPVIRLFQFLNIYNNKRKELRNTSVLAQWLAKAECRARLISPIGMHFGT